MRKIGIAFLLVALLITAAPVSAFAHSAEAPYSTDLVYGRKLTDVGDVRVWNDAEALYVKYVVTKPGWYLFETHLEVKTSAAAIPQASGNAVPGRFTYKNDHEWITEYTYRIPVTWPVGTKLYVAAHGVAGKRGGSVADVCGSLPTTVTEQMVMTDIWYDAIVTGGTSLDGRYLAWSANPYIDIYTAYQYPASVVCSYKPEQLPAGLIDKPENLDLVNWILNQDYPSKGYSLYSVQLAIWSLLQDEPQNLNAGAMEILAAAQANGEGFVPGCGQSVAIILCPWWEACGWKLPTIIMKPVPCYETAEETVWAKGCGFPGADWSMYFRYTIQ